MIQGNSRIQVQIPIIIDPKESPKMYDDDSVSIFHPQTDHQSSASISPLKFFTPKIVSNPPISVIASSTGNSKP